MNGGITVLRQLLKTLTDRLLPQIDDKQDGTGHCHEAAFDPDSFPEALQQQLKKQQGLQSSASDDAKT